MEVIHETSTVQQVRPQPAPPLAKDFTPNVLSEMEKKFQELEAAKAKMIQQMAAPIAPDADDTITKRNAASMLVIALAQKKKLMIVAGGASLFMVVGAAIAGAIGAFIPFALLAIYIAWNFINNEKEIKAYKDKFGV